MWGQPKSPICALRTSATRFLHRSPFYTVCSMYRAKKIFKALKTVSISENTANGLNDRPYLTFEAFSLLNFRYLVSLNNWAFSTSYQIQLYMAVSYSVSWRWWRSCMSVSWWVQALLHKYIFSFWMFYTLLQQNFILSLNQIFGVLTRLAIFRGVTTEVCPCKVLVWKKWTEICLALIY